MNIREDLQRYSIETDQVTRTRRYKWLFAIGWILLLTSIFNFLNPSIGV